MTYQSVSARNRQAQAAEKAAAAAKIEELARKHAPSGSVAHQLIERAVDAAEKAAGHAELAAGALSDIRRSSFEGSGGLMDEREAFEEIGEFTKAVVGQRFGKPLTKVAAPWEIETDARGGFLVPVQVANYIDALLRPEGGLLARCMWHNTEPGRDFRIPSFSTAPVADWQDGENTNLDELDVAVAAMDIKSHACGGYLDCSWQLMHQSAFDVGRHVVGELWNATRQKIETALVQAEGGVSAGPYDGLLHAAGNTQDALATVTSALVSKFVWESIEDAPSLSVDGVLALHPTCFEALAASDSSTNYTGRLRHGSDGLPWFGEYPVIRTPAVPVTDIIMFSPRHVHVVGAGHTLIVDDKSQARSLTVRLVGVSWAGYGVSLADAVSKATLTNIS
jgi:HK97 family phage major capsid protein